MTFWLEFSHEHGTERAVSVRLHHRSFFLLPMARGPRKRWLVARCNGDFYPTFTVRIP